MSDPVTCKKLGETTDHFTVFQHIRKTHGCGVNGVGNHLDIFDQRHTLEHSDRLRAEYMQFCDLPMSKDYEKLLGGNEN